MLKEFSYLGKEKAQEVVKNTNFIADCCDPIEPLPQGLFAPKLEDSDGELKRLVWGKAHELYGEEPPQIVVDRINAELYDIIRCKYDVIYMSAQKLFRTPWSTAIWLAPAAPWVHPWWPLCRASQR